MKVVGLTTQQEVFVGSKKRAFRINEFLIIQDEKQGELMGEVVETSSYNRYIPLNINDGMIDSSVIESLNAIGYNIDDETIHIAKVRLLNEAQYPVETASDVRSPRFHEVKDIMVKTKPKDGLVMGIIKSTDEMIHDMEEDLVDIAPIFDDGHIRAQNEIPFIFDIKSMHQYPHIGIFGGSGSGKSFGMRVLLEEVMKLKIPAVVLDPHFEMDFATIADYFKEEDKVNFSDRFKCLQIGHDVGVKFNDLNTSDLKNLLDASGKLSDAMSNAVDILHKRKDSYQSFHDRLKMLLEAQDLGSIQKIDRQITSAESNNERERWKICKELFEDFDKTCPSSSVRGIMWRLTRLYNDGVFSNDINEITDGLNLGKLMVIQGNVRLLQVFSTYLLNNIYHRRRDFKDAQYKNTTADYFPPFIIATDEAHNFAPKGYDSPSKSILKEISQEGRKYGVFLLLATQRPTLLDETITAQLNTKLVFRTVRSSDIQTIKEETDITQEEGKRLPYLKSGDAFISSAIMGRTFSIRIRAASTTSPHTINPFDELSNRREEDNFKILNLIKDKLPITEMNMYDIVKEIEEDSDNDINFDVDQLKAQLENLVNEGIIVKRKTAFTTSYENIEDK
ncbi:ATP-binding protein [Clostridium sp. D2Q-14]|uniref:ATP-binding protein n=1 Tax=Anaeromonas gelatinilytica TaxID=2683194 RepID=UPI00193B530F|nr:ATP-binding protein [Anaeromonas gelatinilytica]MBS4535922.1 ATP-binding protein [Anaeromonas gelatinilytica]